MLEITVFFSNMFKAEKEEDNADKDRYVEKRVRCGRRDGKSGQAGRK